MSALTTIVTSMYVLGCWHLYVLLGDNVYEQVYQQAINRTAVSISTKLFINTFNGESVEDHELGVPFYT